ncbi:hypothetical protein BDV34DRAFT_189765 [Aspergillus parasiticus]|uniref:Uncharacterized protein n=1 Tax=Aspergillus parasiticus TaxID=5067 RepID=A0A5N6DUS5_ASPPA|nr:hypothetical protein BDV34DRAFT_189765 [Aspergillus parasiticus]
MLHSLHCLDTLRRHLYSGFEDIGSFPSGLMQLHFGIYRSSLVLSALFLFVELGLGIC